MEDVKYHILYWEGESPHGIFLETERELTAKSRKRDGPGRCFCCGHVADSWRHRMDNMQISLRLCEDPNGKHFRQDVDGFHLLSPKMGISYHLSDFGNYLWSMDEKCPTENHIIGTALKVLKKEVLPTTCGVKVSTWNTAEGWQRWLEDKVCELRTGAEQRGGVSVGLILDKDGFEVGSCGISHPYFAHATTSPIREILVALGGPGGIDEAVMQVLEQRGEGHGLHLGLMRVKLPGGLHHSCVALNDLLQFHDQGYLYPIMEDSRSLRGSYQKWRTYLARAVSAWAEPGSAEEKTQALRHFIRNFQSQQTAQAKKADGDAHLPGSTWPKVVAPPAAATYVASFSDAKNYVLRLQAHGSLPSGRWPFRLRGCLESIEPGQAMHILRVVQLKKLEALLKGYDYDPWHELCEDLDAAIASAAATTTAPTKGTATPRDVRTLLVQCREELERVERVERFEQKEEGGSVKTPGATPLELGALNRLSCRDAMVMLNRLKVQKPHVLKKRPADARSTAGLAQHAAMCYALRSGRSGPQRHSALQGMLERKGQRREKRTRESYMQQSSKRPRGGQWKMAEDNSQHWPQQGAAAEESQRWPQQRAEDNSRHWPQQGGPEKDNNQDWQQSGGWNWSWRGSWRSNWEDDGDDDQVPIGQGRNRWPSEPLCPAPGPAHPPPSNPRATEPAYPPLRRTPAPPLSPPPSASAPLSTPLSPLQLAAAEEPPVPLVRRTGRKRCLNTYCHFLANEDEEKFGGFCCIACGKWSKENFKRKTHHGQFCKREPAEGLV